jgi:L-threonylcarbamoyladenylate synthase
MAEITRDVARAAAALRQGALVVYPTETYYGLGALASLPEAVARLAAAKLRPSGKPLPLVAADPEMAFALWLEVPEAARHLAGKFWPGALTLVVAAAYGLPAELARGGAVGVRVPGLTMTRELSRLAQGAIVSTSANPSGGESPASVAALSPWLLERIDLVLDGGSTPGGHPSTVVEVLPTGVRLLRPGAVAWSEIEGAVQSLLPSRGG